MEIELQIETGEECLFRITDLTEYSKSPFNYEDTISISVIKMLTTDELSYEYIPHILNSPVDVKTNFNGCFTYNYIVIPTLKWVENNIDKIDTYSEVYYFANNEIYNYNTKLKIEIKDLININPINTTISKASDNMSSICFLKKKFIDLSKKIYEKRVFSKTSVVGAVNKQLIHKRDLIWTFINLISYYVDKRLWYEALRFIDKYEQLTFKKEHKSCNCNGNN